MKTAKILSIFLIVIAIGIYYLHNQRNNSLDYSLKEIEIQLNSKNYDKVSEILEKALRINPESPKANYLYGKYKCAIGSGSVGIKYLDKAIAWDPYYSIARYSRAACNFDNLRYSDAITDYDNIISANSNEAKAYLMRGKAKYLTGDYKGCIQDVDQAQIMKVIDVDGLQSKAESEAKLKDYISATEDYGRLLDYINDKNQKSDIYYLRGNLRNLLRDPKGAIAEYENALAFSPNNFKAIRAIKATKNRKFVATSRTDTIYSELTE